MPLHERNEVHEKLHEAAESLFASEDMARALPKYRFPEQEALPDFAFQAIKDELLLDGNSRQNLATFCQTWEEPQIHELMDLAINKNLMDKDEYPQSAEVERRCVHMLADLWNAPDAANTVGASSIGSSEACMLAGMAAKWRWRAKQKAAGKPFDKPNMVCGPVQVVWHKFARYWEIEMREIPMSPGKYCMDPEQMLEQIDENTMLVVPRSGSPTPVPTNRCSNWPRPSIASTRRPDSTSTSMSTVRVAHSWPHFVPPRSSSTFGYRGSSPSVPQPQIRFGSARGGLGDLAGQGRAA